MKAFLEVQYPRTVAFIGSITGWVSVENIAHAKDVAQLVAAIIASLVSLCALILTAPLAYRKLKRAVVRVRDFFRG